MKILITNLIVLFTTVIVLAQNITNTLGTGGVFIIKDASNNYFLLNQSTGQIDLLRTLKLENTTASDIGVIYKGGSWFLHNYKPATNEGSNLFLGLMAGNFTMTGAFSFQASRNVGIGDNSLSSLTSGYENTAIGCGSMRFNDQGVFNTAVGFYTLYDNTSGSNNTAIGELSLYHNETGSQNTAVGSHSLYSNDTGEWNTAVGYGAMWANLSGSNNISVGHTSLSSNTSGSLNVAIGYRSLFTNTSGHDNISIGREALYSNDAGFVNLAIGWGSLFNNINGDYNTALGHSSLSWCEGTYNTAIGYGSGSNLYTGSNNTFIGYSAQPSSNNVSNEITLGDADITSLRCNVTSITALSDARDKKNIRNLPLGLDFIMKLKPRIFNWDRRDWYESGVSNGSKIEEKPTAGFIAQELDEIQKTENTEWLNLVLKNNPDKWEATPGNLLPVIVKAIQDLKAENDQLKAELEDIKEVKEQLTEIKILKEELIEQIRILKSNNEDDDVEFSSLGN